MLIYFKPIISVRKKPLSSVPLALKYTLKSQIFLIWELPTNDHSIRPCDYDILREQDYVFSTLTSHGAWHTVSGLLCMTITRV
jgi:hypothetical protein